MTWLLGATVVLYALQTTYSSDAAKGGENLAVLLPPVRALFVLLSMVGWSRELLLRCLAIAVAEAVLFAGVGFVEYDRKSLFLNPKVVAANQFDNYFRVNSVFFDPSIYGRFLALVMIAVCTVVLWVASRRVVIAGGCVLAWLLAGLVTSFSQSSIAALLLGLAVLGAWRCGVRATLLTSAGVLLLALVVLLAAPKSLHFGLKGSGGSTSNATSGRSTLIEGGLKLFAKRPLEGYGSGSFETEYQKVADTTNQNAVSASHTIPVTVSAEQGIVGLRCTWRCCSARSRSCSAAPGALRRGSRSRPASPRWCCTRGRTPTSSRTRSRGRCSRSARRSPAAAVPAGRRRPRNPSTPRRWAREPGPRRRLGGKGRCWTT